MELRQYITIALRWWWLVIVLTCVAAGASYMASQRQTPVYEATTTIMVGQSIQATELDSRDFATSERLARTYTEVAQRQPVLQGVVETLALNMPWQMLKERVQVKLVADTQLLEITAEANSPEEARVIVDEVARQLILLSPTTLQNQEQDENRHFVRQRLANLQTRIEAGQERLAVLEEAMAGSLSAEQVQDLQSEINSLESLITGWENNYTQLLIFIESKKSPNYLAVIEPAQANSRPVRPKVWLNTILAGALGFFLAIGLILMIEYLDDTLKSADDLSQSLDLTALGTIGRMKGKSHQDKLLSAQDPFSPVTEAYRMIRSNIQFMSVDHPVKSFMVTSSTAGEGKSTTVANLGIIMAQAGLKTIIVDADMRRPMQQYIFQIPHLGGLTEVLRSPELDFREQLINTHVENLQLLPCGELPPNPSELLGSQRMGQLLVDLSEAADIVIYDSPPALVVTDAAVLSGRVDGVVLVIDAGQTRREAIRQAISNLQRAGAHLYGGILNRISKTKGGYYYQGYYATSSKPQSSGQQDGYVTLGIPVAAGQGIHSKSSNSNSDNKA